VRIDGFDWDDGNRAKSQKHGVSLEEIEEALGVIDLLVDDPFSAEKCYRTVGKTKQGRHIFALFTLRGGLLRPISVRYMQEKELAQYEEEMARLAKR
jgi:uncharacterized DUF497 family protein